MRKTTAKSTIANIIKKHIYDNIREYAIVSILFLIGLILGVIFINNANETQIMQITLGKLRWQSLLPVLQIPTQK